MKKLLMVVVLMLSVATMSDAAYVNLFNLPYVYSPSSDSSPYTPPTTDDAFLNQYGSLYLGEPAGSADSFTYAPGTPQAGGIYGVGALLPSAGSGGYNLWFDYHLDTYDAGNVGDVFRVVITANNYLWAGGTIVGGGFSWGGANVGGLEQVDVAPAFQGFVDVAGGSPYYLNAVMIVDSDTYASYGRISDIAVEVVPGVPEPSTLLLLGSGLLGLLGYGRKRMKK